MTKTSYRGRLDDGAPNPVDSHVGSRVRQRRLLLGMSQEALGVHLGLTFQQVQKYERGANRIGASRLFDLSKALEVPVSFFFEEMPGGAAQASPAQIAAGAADQTIQPTAVDPMAKRETLELVRSYYRIGNPATRASIFNLVKSVGAAGIGDSLPLEGEIAG